MKKMKHGGKARKTHKRMQDGGMADYGEAARPMAYSKGRVGTPAFRPVGRPDMPSSPDRGGYLKPGMRPLASSDAYMRRPPRGGSAIQRASFDAQLSRGGKFGGALPSMEEAQPVRLPGRGSAMSAVEQGLGLQVRPDRGGSLKPGMRPLASSEAYMRKPPRGGYATQGSSFSAQPAPRPVFRPGTNIRDALKASSDYLTQNPQYMTSTARPAAPMAAEAPAQAFRKGGAVKGKKMRGGGLARKGVGMALAKGGLAKRAGGCAKRGVGRGKMV